MTRSNVMTAAIAAAALLTQPVLAAGLEAGKPAGVKEAQGVNLVALGIGAVIVAAVAIAVGTSGNGPAAPVTPPATTPTTT